MKRSQEVRKTKNRKEIIKSIKLPYIQRTTNKTTNILRKKQIRVALSPFNTLHGILDHAKDQPDPKKNKGASTERCTLEKLVALS